MVTAKAINKATLAVSNKLRDQARAHADTAERLIDSSNPRARAQGQAMLTASHVLLSMGIAVGAGVVEEESESG